ncbi:hypothetical protein HDU99_006132, partial [Rhizoclosmatium hyalinum]
MNNQCQIYNSFLHSDHTITPHQALFGKKPTVRDLKTMFQTMYIRVLPKNYIDGKVSPRAVRGRYIGHSNYPWQPRREHPGYRCLTIDNDATSIMVGRDVYFREDHFHPGTHEPLSAPIRSLSWSDFRDDTGFPHDPETIQDNLERRRSWGVLTNDETSESVVINEVERDVSSTATQPHAILSPTPSLDQPSTPSDYGTPAETPATATPPSQVDVNVVDGDSESEEEDTPATPTPAPRRTLRSNTTMPAFSKILGNDGFEDSANVAAASGVCSPSSPPAKSVSNVAAAS